MTVHPELKYGFFSRLRFSCSLPGNHLRSIRRLRNPSFWKTGLSMPPPNPGKS